MTYTKGDDAPRRGHARMKQLAVENQAAIQMWKSAMLAGLGRSWTVAEEITAETIASLFNRAAKLRDQGRDDTELLYKACILMRDSVFRDPRAYVPPAPSGMAAPQ